MPLIFSRLQAAMFPLSFPVWTARQVRLGQIGGILALRHRATLAHLPKSQFPVSPNHRLDFLVQGCCNADTELRQGMRKESTGAEWWAPALTLSVFTAAVALSDNTSKQHRASQRHMFRKPSCYRPLSPCRNSIGEQQRAGSYNQWNLTGKRIAGVFLVTHKPRKDSQVPPASHPESH